jgi:hypothetical protein
MSLFRAECLNSYQDEQEIQETIFDFDSTFIPAGFNHDKSHKKISPIRAFS